MVPVCNSGNGRLDCAVIQWMKWDKNSETREEVRNQVAGKKWSLLEKSMMGRQKFGTAGLRGRMGAGTMCMNDVVILQTSQGLCSYLKKVCNQSQLENGIVVGFDGRYNSKRFAELTAKVFVSNSIKVHLFSDVCPTPLVAFATIHYGCAGGVMVTASHNPKEDNGYKVYWSNGSQIITPHDDNIIEEIKQNLDIPEEHWNISEIRSHELVTDCLQEVTSNYLSYIEQCLTEEAKKTNKDANIDTIYTAMHGVGYEFVKKSFESVNLKVPISVKQQQNPDPDFPTVKFPNPEETECLNLSKALAEEKGVKLVLANDPDADRLAVAEYDVVNKSWKVFNGNEMGALLGWWLLEQYKKNPTVDPHRVFFIASVVSSKMLQSMATAEGYNFVETLTGFKWMGNTSLLLAKEGKLPLFAFEEAIGYMCNHRVPDKDGVSAAVQVASLASYLYSSGLSLSSQLQNLYSKYGYHVSHNSYYICYDPDTIKKIFRRIRNYHASGAYPKKVGSSVVISVHDLAAGVKKPESSQDDGNLSTIGTGLDIEYTGGEMIMFKCGNGLSVTVRTSGTEPKLKYYTELVADADTPEQQEQVKTKLVELVNEFVEELLQPKENGLTN